MTFNECILNLWTIRIGEMTPVEQSFHPPKQGGLCHKMEGYASTGNDCLLFRPLNKQINVIFVPMRFRVDTGPPKTLSDKDIFLWFIDCSITNWYDLLNQKAERCLTQRIAGPARCIIKIGIRTCSLRSSKGIAFCLYPPRLKPHTNKARTFFM
jgi:hypothetical protein